MRWGACGPLRYAHWISNQPFEDLKLKSLKSECHEGGSFDLARLGWYLVSVLNLHFVIFTVSCNWLFPGGTQCIYATEAEFMVQQGERVRRLQAVWGWPICLQRALRMEAVYKVCGTAGLWATLACAVVGPSASSGEERSYNIQSAEVKRSVKHEVSTAATVGTLHAVSLKKVQHEYRAKCCFAVFPVNSAVAHFSIPAHLSSSQHLAVAYSICFQRRAVEFWRTAWEPICSGWKPLSPTIWMVMSTQTDIFARP